MTTTSAHDHIHPSRIPAILASFRDMPNDPDGSPFIPCDHLSVEDMPGGGAIVRARLHRKERDLAAAMALGGLWPDLVVRQASWRPPDAAWFAFSPGRDLAWFATIKRDRLTSWDDEEVEIEVVPMDQAPREAWQVGHLAFAPELGALAHARGQAQHAQGQELAEVLISLQDVVEHLRAQGIAPRSGAAAAPEEPSFNNEADARRAELTAALGHAQDEPLPWDHLIAQARALATSAARPCQRCGTRPR